MKKEAKVNPDTTTGEKEADTKQEMSDGAEESKTPAAKREREMDNDEDSEEELDDTPPMYRQARGLFLKPEVWITACAVELPNDIVLSNVTRPVVSSTEFAVNMH